MMIGLDLFSGAGGMSLGAMQCGVNVKYAVEIDLETATTFKNNHPEVDVLRADIGDVDHKYFSDLIIRTEPLIIFGGPPCQGFSTSNQRNRNSSNSKNWLFLEYLRLVKALKPEWVIFENVKGILETEKGLFFNSIVQGFEQLGYGVQHFVLNSANFGVPQIRNRLFLIASLQKKEIKIPEPQSQIITVAEALADLPLVSNGNMVCEQKYSALPVSSYAKNMRGNNETCFNNLVTRNASHIIERYRFIPQGGNWENIPKKLMGNYKDVSRCHTGIYRRLKDSEPSVVIGNFRKNMLIHPWLDRGLSVREAARLQSFPDSFIFSGTIGSQQQQVGNAVPPLLAKAIFEQVMKAEYE
ncbi:DNA cytosine methyltransferase [Acinetobacter courvalinii]|uniref:DNA cytosine methyltransferase n=1 Tax=Acinetobacter courvalinii TaxID=280147 RepID=UPI00190089F1|nr:DNA cytosine methyltransferase [Acinetobacter courvalinii]MBJ9957584.1 DNA cytosine methyltransferase [Acinetobacter courvalinii]